MTFNLKGSGVERADAQIFLEISRLSTRTFDLDGVLSVRPGLSVTQAHDFLGRMLGAGLLDAIGGVAAYDMSELGHSLAHSGLRDRITPEAAQRLLEKAIERARAWNADQDGFVFVTGIKLFGSFLEKKETYGDIDIEIVTTPRKLDDSARERLAEAPQSILRSMFYRINPEKMLLAYQSDLAVKNIGRGLPDLSTTTAGTIDSIGASWQEVYAFDPETQKEQRPKPKRHPRAFPRMEAEKTATDRSTALIRPEAQDYEPEISVEHVSSSWLSRSAEMLWHKTREGQVPGETAEDQHLSAQMRFIDDHLSWDLSATENFDMIREIHLRGIDAGILGSGPIRFDFSKKDMSCIIPSADDSDLIFRFWYDGAARDIMLLPEVVPTGAGPVSMIDFPLSDLGGHISVARSLAVPMFDAHDALKIPSGVDVKLAFSWDSRLEVPVLPSLAPMARAAIKEARNVQINQSDLEPLRKAFKGSSNRWPGLLIVHDVAISLTAGKDPSVELLATGRSFRSRGEVPVRCDWSAADLVGRAQREISRLEGIGSDWSLSVRRTHRESIRADSSCEHQFRLDIETAGIRIEEDVPEEAPAFGM